MKMRNKSITSLSPHVLTDNMLRSNHFKFTNCKWSIWMSLVLWIIHYDELPIVNCFSCGWHVLTAWLVVNTKGESSFEHRCALRTELWAAAAVCRHPAGCLAALLLHPCMQMLQMWDNDPPSKFSVFSFLHEMGKCLSLPKRASSDTRLSLIYLALVLAHWLQAGSLPLPPAAHAYF